MEKPIVLEPTIDLSISASFISKGLEPIKDGEVPVVGKNYLVTCVNYRGTWIPVIPVLAEDSDAGLYIKYASRGKLEEQRHWHVDSRFLDRDMYHHESPISSIPLKPGKRVVYKERTCVSSLSEINPFLNKYTAAAVPEYLKKSNKTKALKEGNVFKCPHKGMTLELRGGFLVCPGHCSVFDPETLELVDPSEYKLDHGSRKTGIYRVKK